MANGRDRVGPAPPRARPVRRARRRQLVLLRRRRLCVAEDFTRYDRHAVGGIRRCVGLVRRTEALVYLLRLGYAAA
ncbi:hypothetical protein OG900_05350 [Streptomyces sp. NBC_00433]